MRIISCNVNGLRAAVKRGFSNCLKKLKGDFICLQEVKLSTANDLDQYFPFKYQYFTNLANKKGYSGVMILTKLKPLNVITKLGLSRFDEEGRLLCLEYEDYYLVNIYIPHGGREKQNLDYKLEVYQYLFKLLDKLSSKPIILVGDFNIAHQFIDVEKAKYNVKNIMFTEEERQQITNLMNKGYVDAFRLFTKEKGFYTWFPYMNNLRDKNVGWRIDYTFVSETLVPKIQKTGIINKYFISDHNPIILDIDL